MSEITSLPNYDEIQEALQSTDSPISPSEAHGLLCGIICATAGRIDAKWDKLIFGSKKNANSKALLQQLFATTYQQISEFSFEFILLLPDIEVDINTRAEALGYWCQGFLTGLEQGPHSIEAGASPDAIEALNDITEIAQVSHGNITDSDEDENSYLELVEYVRLAILMLYQEFKKEPPDTKDNNLLH